MDRPLPNASKIARDSPQPLPPSLFLCLRRSLSIRPFPRETLVSQALILIRIIVYRSVCFRVGVLCFWFCMCGFCWFCSIWRSIWDSSEFWWGKCPRWVGNWCFSYFSSWRRKNLRSLCTGDSLSSHSIPLFLDAYMYSISIYTYIFVLMCMWL